MMQLHEDLHVSPHLHDVPICQTYPDKHLPCLLNVGVESAYRPGSTIVRTGDHASFVYVITSGTAESFIEPPAGVESTNQLQRVVNRGDMFGLMAALEGRPHVSDLVARTNVWVLAVSRESLIAELKSHPETADALMDELSTLVEDGRHWLVEFL